jgi:NAD+ kinase
MSSQKLLSSIAIVTNSSKEGADELTLAMEDIARKNKVVTKKTSEFPCPKGFISDVDACFVVGGDGTLLGVMKEAVNYGVPLVGIRHGQLGFLATLSPEDIEISLPKLFSGFYNTRHRSLIEYADANNDLNFALNDLVVKSGTNSRLSRFSVCLNDEHVSDYACDGIVFSTPTGSTAYNLAAGGPIAHPDAQVVLMTPISAHSLTSRSVVFPSGVSLRISALDNVDIPLVSADGQPAFLGIPQFPVHVSVSSKKISLLELEDHSHFKVLRNKLKWG